MWKLQENVLEDKDKKALVNYIEHTDRFTQFERVKLFERMWSEWLGCKYSVFVNSGSSADLLMLDAIKELYGISDGREVLVPSVTWATNITSVIQAKLQPVFVDVNLDDLSFDYEELERKMTQKTRIILVTHLLGIPANIEILRYIAHKHDLILLEDCCEAHGATHRGKKVGTFGEASTFSFYWGHHMTTIEGGMVCTDNEHLYDLLVMKRSHGLARELNPDKHEYHKQEYPNADFNFLFLTNGYNVRNTELHAEIGIAQLVRIDEYIKIRNNNYNSFVKILDGIKDKLYIPIHEGISSFCLPFIFKEGEKKEYLQNRLRQEGIETRPIVGGNLLRQPCFKHLGLFSDYTNAEIIHLNGFYIGNNQYVNEERLSLLKSILYDKG